MKLTGRIDKGIVKDYRIIDTAWDEFSDYIGENNISTPLTIEEFEDLFKKLNKDGKYTEMKSFILESFQHDSYMWPLVKKNQ